MKKIFSLLCFFMLFSWLEAWGESVLNAEQAFQFQFNLSSHNMLHAIWKIAPDYYLYQDSIHIQTNLPISRWAAPLSQQHHDKRTIYTNRIDIPIEILADVPQLQITVEYQGCYKKTVCYLPVKKEYLISFIDFSITPISSSISSLQNTQPDTSLEIKSIKDISNIQAKQINHLLENHSLFFILLMFLFFGIFIGMTPCVMPMIPILMTMLAMGKNLPRHKLFLIGLFYVLGMALAYALAGLFAAWVGKSLQIMLQNTWVIVFSSGVFIYMAYVLWKGQAWETPALFQKILRRFILDSGLTQFFSALTAGATAMLIISPCVTAPLIGILLFIAQTGNLFLGFAALFILGIGQGIPVLLFSFVAKHLWQRVQFLSRYIEYILIVILLLMSLNMLWRLQPIHQFISNTLFGRSHTAWKTIQATEELNLALNQAQKNHRAVIMDFYADWCESCQIIEKEIFANSQIQAQLKHFALLKIDLSQNSNESHILMKQYNIIAPPTIVFISSSGKEETDLRLVGKFDLNQFKQQLKKFSIEGNRYEPQR